MGPTYQADHPSKNSNTASSALDHVYISQDLVNIQALKTAHRITSRFCAFSEPPEN